MSAAPRIVLFGATGFTGRLTAAALVRRGTRPVLAGRDAAALEELAEALEANSAGKMPTAGGVDTAAGAPARPARRLDTVVADAGRPETVRALVREGDVLVSTAGPFVRLGAAAVEAAVSARATYLDAAAEPAFLRAAFERHGPRAGVAGCALLPATGYESVPGNLAAALALRHAGAAATAVEVAYFATGRFATSGGTRASFAAAALAPGFAFRDGALVAERGARRVRAFEVAGRRRPAISAAMVEHLTLPRLHPRLRRVDTYLGWYGRASRALQAASLAGAPAVRLRGARRPLDALAARAVRGSTGGPPAERRARAGSHVLALARDDAARPLARVDLEGVDGYDFTANVLAWAATRAAAGQVTGTGAIGPVEAFGLDELERGCAEAGMRVAAG